MVKKANIIKEEPEAKYLGIIFRKNWPVYKNQGEAAISKARRIRWLAHHITKKTSNPAYFGSNVWSCFGLPAVLYGWEVIQIPSKYVLGVEMEQRELMRAITKLPRHTNVLALYAETGLRPIRFTLGQLTLNFWSYVMGLPNERLVKTALLAQMFHFQQKGWDWTDPPPDRLDLEYKNCHLWLKTVGDYAAMLNFGLDRVATKQKVKNLCKEAWYATYYGLSRDSQSLKFYESHKWPPLVEVRHKSSLASWWTKAKTGAIVPPAERGKPCPLCPNEGLLCSLEHLLWTCKAIPE